MISRAGYICWNSYRQTDSTLIMLIMWLMRSGWHAYLCNEGNPDPSVGPDELDQYLRANVPQ